MNLITKQQPLAVTQIKKISEDGTVKYYFSKPKVKLSNISGRLWVWRRIRVMKKEREK